jgi:site-specific DNA-methyltransferase (cytosine-N4-specific)
LFAKQARYFYDAAAIAEPVTDQRAYPTWEQRKADGAAIRRGDPGQSGDQCHWAGIGGNNETRNARDVFTIPTEPYEGAHFAVMPTELARRCILAGSRPGDVVADPFTGAGTVGVVALRHGRGFWGAELNESYVQMARERIVGDSPLFNRQEGAA